MKFAAIILLIGVVVRHYGIFWLSDLTGFSSQAIIYILSGLWEFVLCGILLFIAYGYRWSIWRGLACSALLIGMVEGLMQSGCRLAVKDVRAAKGANLCDYATGLPVGAVVASLAIVMIAWHFGRLVRERTR